MVGDKVWINPNNIPYSFALLTELFYNQYGNRVPLVQVKETLQGVLFNNLFSQLPELYALMEAQDSKIMANIKNNGFGETYQQSGNDTVTRTGKVTQTGSGDTINSTSDASHSFDFETNNTFRDSIASRKNTSDQDSNSTQSIDYGKTTTKTTSRVFEYLSDADIGNLILKWLENFNGLFKTVLHQNTSLLSPELAELIQLNFSWNYITGSPNDNGAFVSYMKDFRSYLASTYMPKFWIDPDSKYGLYWDVDSLNRPVLRANFGDDWETIKEQVDKNTSNIEVLESNVGELQDQVNENTNNIEINKNDIDTLRNDLGDVGNIQNQLISELQKLIEKVAKGQILHIDGPYDVNKTYLAGSLVFGQDTTGVEFAWLSLQDNNQGNPLVDNSEWWYKLLRTGDISISLDDYYNKAAIDTMLTQYATVSALQALNATVNQNKTDIANNAGNISKINANYVNTNNPQTITAQKTFRELVTFSGSNAGIRIRSNNQNSLRIRALTDGGGATLFEQYSGENETMSYALRYGGPAYPNDLVNKTYVDNQVEKIPKLKLDCVWIRISEFDFQWKDTYKQTSRLYFYSSTISNFKTKIASYIGEDATILNIMIDGWSGYESSGASIELGNYITGFSESNHIIGGLKVSHLREDIDFTIKNHASVNTGDDYKSIRNNSRVFIMYYKYE